MQLNKYNICRSTNCHNKPPPAISLLLHSANFQTMWHLQLSTVVMDTHRLIQWPCALTFHWLSSQYVFWVAQQHEHHMWLWIFNLLPKHQCHNYSETHNANLKLLLNFKKWIQKFSFTTWTMISKMLDKTNQQPRHHQVGNIYKIVWHCLLRPVWPMPCAETVS